VAQTLQQRGWTNVRPLLGGFDAWRRAGYPMEAKAARPLVPSEVGENLRQAEGSAEDVE
jgi:3-mercaptopyruvate sulfurtransferase SseA